MGTSGSYLTNDDRASLTEQFGCRPTYADHLTSVLRFAFNNGNDDLEPIVEQLRRNCPHWFYSDRQWRKHQRTQEPKR